MATMTDSHHHSAPAKAEPQPEMLGYLAEFDSVEALLKAAEKTRDAGFKKFDCFTPFPIHGLDDAMGTKPTILPFIVLGAACVGGLTALGMQIFTNGIDYQYLISGKPIISMPSNIPVLFELMVLFSAFATFLGMLALNELPKLYNALFRVSPFRDVTTDKFFLGIEAADPKFVEDKTKSFLEGLSPLSISDCIEPHTQETIPKQFGTIALVLLVIGLIPASLVARWRSVPSDAPRLHPQWDMDFQPKVKAQTVNNFFRDGRGNRPPIAGTVARGELRTDVAMFMGLIPEKASEVDPATLERTYKLEDGTTPKLNDYPWLTEIPLAVDAELMKRGQQRFNIYCSTCHGLTGKGDGLVSMRASEIANGTWVKPVSLTSEGVAKQPAGQLFNTITHGVRKMPGYASQIDAKDRWAIVLYLRALQKSVIPVDALDEAQRAEIEAMEAEAAAAAAETEPTPVETEPEPEAPEAE